MNYLNRPIFPFAINWDEAVQRSLTFDLRETALGFGAEYFSPTEEYDVTGWEFALYHKSNGSGQSDILAFECFADQVVGRLNGFWLPSPLQAATFVKALSAQVIVIKPSGWAQTWNERPDQFLMFNFLDGTSAPAQIETVSTGDASGTWPAGLNIPIDEIDPAYEYIILTEPLPEVPGPGTGIQRLHYVRFANDAEEMTCDADNMGVMKISVVELPLEYTLQATGLQPIYLYQISMKAPVQTVWNYTSFAAPVVANGTIFKPWPMTHGAIKQSTDGNSNPVKVTAKFDPAHPFSLLGGTPPGAVMWLTIMRCYIGNPNATTNIFVGFVDFMSDGTDKVEATVQSRLAWLKTKIPRFFIGTICNWVLYDPNTCGVGAAFFTTVVTIKSVVASQLPQLQCSFNFAFETDDWQTVNWFQGGSLQAGVGLNYEVRSIVASEWIPANGNVPGYLLLTLSARLKKNGAGAQCSIAAGCDHTANGQNGCGPKFNNFPNFGAFVDVPEENLSLKGIDNSNAMGGKKA
jgi:hypothetical protein